MPSKFLSGSVGYTLLEYNNMFVLLFADIHDGIEYCKKNETFYYTTNFEFSFRYTIVAISDEDAVRINGGVSLYNANTFFTTQ